MPLTARILEASVAHSRLLPVAGNMASLRLVVSRPARINRQFSEAPTAKG
jgi:hypothetical protein